MKIGSSTTIVSLFASRALFVRNGLMRMILACSFLLGTAGFTHTNAADTASPEKFILQAGDQLQISFPGAPELDLELQVRRDGVVSMPIVGEVLAAGKTPHELEEELVVKYKNELVSNEVMVVVLESHFTYYLEGEVRVPGIITSFRQLSVLEAIIAAGGVNKTTGKLSLVIVIRRSGDSFERFDLSLKAILTGKTDKSFVLQSYDVVSVPQKVW